MLLSSEITISGQNLGNLETKYIAKNDTTENGEDIDADIERETRTKRNIAKDTLGQEDYLSDKYVMERRHRGINEDGSKHWYDNLFVQAGAGAEQIIPYSEDFHFDPLTTAHYE